MFFIGSLVPYKSKLMLFWNISGSALILLTLTSPLTGLVFTVDAVGHYERGIFVAVVKPCSEALCDEIAGKSLEGFFYPCR